ncbi:SKI family transcriptional corepressor 1 [Protobothrops mucrosquamatus]|uniref:SKI family transcriptional corepressor 1 n=1 Tax=Protobothrops mucrosquamatus TaxID=103944 RepID=UPI0010FBA49C|nr:SKI family transcriptional corepressor 1 [Protobothrops mucrosquamatus]
MKVAAAAAGTFVVAPLQGPPVDLAELLGSQAASERNRASGLRSGGRRRSPASACSSPPGELPRETPGEGAAWAAAEALPLNVGGRPAPAPAQGGGGGGGGGSASVRPSPGPAVQLAGASLSASPASSSFAGVRPPAAEMEPLAAASQLGAGRESGSSSSSSSSASSSSSSSPHSKQELQPYAGPGPLKPNQVGETSLYGVPIVSLVIDGQERLCLAQISNTLLKNYSYNEIHNRRVALGITCVQCTPVQLEILRRAGAMPISSRRCGMITKREAERLCKSFLGEHKPPKLPENFAFDVVHECAWGSRGSFIPARYNSSRAKCIKCSYCSMYFSPNKFIFHSHRTPDAKYTQPDAANFNSWRRHLKLSDKGAADDLSHAWEDVKAMFNGGTRKRTFSLQGGGGGSSAAKSALHPPPPAPPDLAPAHKSLRCSGGADEAPGTERGGLGLPPGAHGPAAAAVRSYPVIPVPSKGFGMLQKLPPPLFPPPYGFPAAAFGLCPKKQEDPLGGGGGDPSKGSEPSGSERSSATPQEGCGGTGEGERCPSALSRATAALGEEERSGDEALLAPLPLPRKGSYLSAFRPVVKDAESIAKLYGTREVYAGPRGCPGYLSPDFLSEGSSSYRSLSPGNETAGEPDVDVETNRFAEDDDEDEEEDEAPGGDAPPPPPPLLPEADASLAAAPGGGLATAEKAAEPEESPSERTSSRAGYEAYPPGRDHCPQALKAVVSLGPPSTPYPCAPEKNDPEDDPSAAEEPEGRKASPRQRSASQPSPTQAERGEEVTLLDVTGTQLGEKDLGALARDELQRLLLEQMDLRKKLEREFQSLKDNFQDQMKRELAYREEMVQQLQIVRDTLCNELDQERKARYAIQQKLKEAHDALHHFSCKMLTPRHCAGNCSFKPPLLPQ